MSAGRVSSRGSDWSKKSPRTAGSEHRRVEGPGSSRRGLSTYPGHPREGIPSPTAGPRQCMRLMNGSMDALTDGCIDGWMPQVCVDIFRERGHQADVKSNLTVEQLHGIVGNYDGMVVRSATKARWGEQKLQCRC